MDEDKQLVNGQLIFEHHLPAKLVIPVHADHYDKHYTNDHQVLWNNFYEYQFQHAKYVDSFIVATNEQKKILKNQFKKYYNIEPWQWKYIPFLKYKQSVKESILTMI